MVSKKCQQKKKIKKSGQQQCFMSHVCMKLHPAGSCSSIRNAEIQKELPFPLSSSGRAQRLIDFRRRPAIPLDPQMQAQVEMDCSAIGKFKSVSIHCGHGVRCLEKSSSVPGKLSFVKA